MRNNRLLCILLVILATIVANFLVPRPPEPEISLRAEAVPLFGLHIPNSIIATWLIMLVLILLSYLATRRLETVPGRLQSAVEWAVESLYNLANSITAEHTRLVFPVVATLFFFILAANWMELLPGFGSVGIWTRDAGEAAFIPLLRSADTDLNTTIALAIFAVASIQAFGLIELGPAYFSRFFDIQSLRGEGNFMQRIASVFIGLLELFDQFTKIVSFAFRLFGNIFAGEVLLLVVSFLLPVIGPLPFIALEIFVGFIQALIFALLTLVYVSSAVRHEDQQTTAEATAATSSAGSQNSTL
jgi:F-type H+-transporting ATPase subunit a